MNTNYVLFHLGEAQEALGKMIQKVETDPDYDFGHFLVDMTHLYHHVNTAWNARNASVPEAENQTDNDFYEWRKFPEDIDLGRS